MCDEIRVLKAWGVCCVLVLGGIPSAQAVNRCVSPTGGVVFQDAPCAGKGEEITVRPSRGKVKEPEPLQATPATDAGASRSGDGTTMTKAQRINAQVEESQRQRRVAELKERLIPAKQRELKSLYQACKKEFDRLQNLRDQAPEDRAIAIAQSLVAGQCNAKQRQHVTKLESLAEECRNLYGDCQ